MSKRTGPIAMNDASAAASALSGVAAGRAAISEREQAHTRMRENEQRVVDASIREAETAVRDTAGISGVQR